MKIKSLILFLLFSGTVSAQTLIKGIVTDSLNNPVPGASVYLSKTTIGTLTNQKGEYSLNISENGIYELVVASVGYKSEMRVITSDRRNQTLNFKLSMNYVLLNDVSVMSRSKNKRKFYNQFVRAFIGPTYQSKSCKIINPQDLRVFRDSQTGMLRAYSLKPLRIENTALGYTLIYDLLDFSYDDETDAVKFSGYNHFLPMEGSESRTEGWNLHRLSAYYGSKLHFLRSLFSDSLRGEGYQILRCNYYKNTKAYQATNPLKREDLVFLDNTEYSSLYFDEPVVIQYTDKHPELERNENKAITSSPGMIMSYTIDFVAPDPDKPLETIISFSDTLSLYGNGYFSDPYAISWGGEMAMERIGDALPFDYFPDGDGLKESFREFTSDEIYLEDESLDLTEKVYLHTDRDYYVSGDDIWFKSYVVDAFSGMLSLNSARLHVELISPSSKIIQDRDISIDTGTGNGDFRLPDTCQSGVYTLRAYTNHMRNFDDSFFFTKKLKVINPYDTTGGSVIPERKIENKISVRFFPEGGSLVENVSSAIAFKAVNAVGKWCDVKGRIYDSDNKLITEFSSSHLGMGSFRLTPANGKSYYALVRAVDGTETKAELPASFASGIVLSTKLTPEKNLMLNVSTNAVTLSQASKQEITVCLSARELRRQKLRISIDELMNTFLIPLDSLPEGVIKITVSGSDAKPLAERLFFLQRSEDVRLNIQTDKSVYEPREKVQASISFTGPLNVSGNGEFSFSAVESRLNSSSTGTVASWFLLESDVRGPVEEPSYYFDPTNINRIRDLDLLLMTQGWRDFKWKYDTINSYKNETGFSISGQARKGRKPLVGEVINLGIFSQGSSEIVTALTDKNGRYEFNGLDLKGKAGIFISSGKDNGTVNIDSLSYIPPEVCNTTDSVLLTLIVKEIPFYRTDAIYRIENKKRYKLDDTISIGEVFITAEKLEKEQQVHIRESRMIYRDPDKEIIVPVTAENYSGDVFSYISGRVPGLIILRGQNPCSLFYPDDAALIIRGQYSIEGVICPQGVFDVKRGALLFLDGHEIDSMGLGFVLGMPMYAIDRIDVIDRSGYIYGMRGANGAINIITKQQIRRDPVSVARNSAYTEIKGYDSPRIFYSPDYESNQTGGPDDRSTLYWNPDVKMVDGEEVKVKFYNADGAKMVKLTVEGITSEGIPLTGKATYTVE